MTASGVDNATLSIKIFKNTLLGRFPLSVPASSLLLIRIGGLMCAADTNEKDLQYIKQGTGSADPKATGAALKRQAEKLSKIGQDKTGRVPGKEVGGGDTTAFLQVDRALKRCQYSQDALIEVLHTAQETFGFLSDETMTYIAQQLKLPPSWVYGVATFYHFFNLKPQGQHTCTICMGTACFVKRAGDIVESLENEYAIKAGETTPDGKLSINIARCLGNCGLAPMIILDGKVLAKQTPESMQQNCREVIRGGSKEE
jgi:bidirectional [NiFe] hydrogenase diaphorase subunit